MTTPDLHAHPEVRRARRGITEHLERLATRTGEDTADRRRILQALAEQLESDPTLAVRGEGLRWLDLIGELVRQLGPLGRQAALVAERDRLEADATLTDTERRRAVNRLGKLNTLAPAEYAALRGRADELLQELAALARSDWHTRERRRALALEMMPRTNSGTRPLAEIADQLRRSVADAVAIDPDLPEAHRLLDLAEEIEAAGQPRACAAPGCTEPLPPAEPGRERRYCSPPCRRRARRAVSTNR
ncbi:hypothetical protein [Nocardiopsis sp. NPDC006938]|uniref:hypothetical protein n=1 Tax=Nocardiopsis sp. NPDC006938 TaxID=3364337 RepID=UPI0036A54F53